MEAPEKFSHCYARTLRIENEDAGSCSGFVLRYREHDWLVTARHVVTEIIVPGNGERIKLRDRPFTVFDKDDDPHSYTELGKLDMVDFRADVTVFRLWSKDIDFGPPLLPVGENEVHAIQDVYFLGFPGFDLSAAYGLTPMATTPLIKRAMVSGKANHYDIEVWLLDGMANHGFSGGPVVTLDPKSESYRVLGVITGHAPANIRVNPALIPSDPHRVGVAPLLPDDRFWETNSGNATCFNIRHAIDDIDNYPTPAVGVAAQRCSRPWQGAPGREARAEYSVRHRPAPRCSRRRC